MRKSIRYLAGALFVWCVVSSGADEPAQQFQLTELSENLKSAKLIISINSNTVYSRETGSRKGDRVKLAWRSGDELRIRAEKTVPGLFRDKNVILLDRVSSTKFALSELTGHRIEAQNDAGTFLRLDPQFEPGRYRVRLLESTVSPEDVVKCGGSPDNREVKKKVLDDVLSWYYSNESSWVKLKEIGKRESSHLVKSWWEKVNPWVRVSCNGKVIFDTKQNKLCPVGPKVVWENAEFELDWKPGDRITIELYDSNSWPRKSTGLFSQSTDTPSAILMLNGEVRNKSGSSVRFGAERRKD